jgi:hypothetical protein
MKAIHREKKNTTNVKSSDGNNDNMTECGNSFHVFEKGELKMTLKGYEPY